MKGITIRTNNSAEGIKKIEKLWQDVMRGSSKLILAGNITPIAKYSNYDSDENGDYDLTILAVDYNYMQQLERGCMKGKFRKYDFCSENTDIAAAIKAVWQKVDDDVREGKIKRSYTEDYECTIPPDYSRDNKLHCLLYIAIENVDGLKVKTV